MKKLLFIILGTISFILGTIGVFIPILPTTPFYILTSFLWINSSEKLHNYLVHTSYYQKYIQEMIKEKKMTKKDQRRMYLGIFLLLAIPFVIVDKLYLRVILVAVFLGHVLFFSNYFKKKAVATKPEKIVKKV